MIDVGSDAIGAVYLGSWFLTLHSIEVTGEGFVLWFGIAAIVGSFWASDLYRLLTKSPEKHLSTPGKKAGFPKGKHNIVDPNIFPQQVYLWGSILEKKIDWTRWWARWAWLGADLALLGALGWVGRGVWPCWGLAVLGALAGLGVLAVLARWLGWAWWGALWAWGLAVLALAVGRVERAGRASWVGRGVGRGVWPCWERWAGVGVGFGDGGRADWVGRGVQSRKVYYRSTK